MLAICDGVAKSGSTFLFTLIKNILQHAKQLDPHLNSKDFLDSIPANNQGLFFPPASINDATALLITKKGTKSSCIKTHLWQADIELCVPHFIFCTARDPFDNALSLYEQFLKEKDNPSLNQRFQECSSLSICLQSTIGYLKILLKRCKNKSTSTSTYIYPEFISPSDSICEDIIVNLSLQGIIHPSQVIEIADNINNQSKQGNLWTEFNKGIAGRGREKIDLFASEKIEEAEQVFEKIKQIAVH